MLSGTPLPVVVSLSSAILWSWAHLHSSLHFSITILVAMVWIIGSTKTTWMRSFQHRFTWNFNGFKVLFYCDHLNWPHLIRAAWVGSYFVDPALWDHDWARGTERSGERKSMHLKSASFFSIWSQFFVHLVEMSLRGLIWMWRKKRRNIFASKFQIRNSFSILFHIQMRPFTLDHLDKIFCSEW